MLQYVWALELLPGRREYGGIAQVGSHDWDQTDEKKNELLEIAEAIYTE